MIYKLNGRELRPGRSFEVNGYVYNYTWMLQQSDEVRESLGIVTEQPARFNRRFYIDANTPRDLAEAKAQLVSEQKSAAGQTLSDTDWYVIRSQEESTAIPANVTTFRQAVRRVSGERETLINNAADIPALQALYTAPAEIFTPGSEESTPNPDPFLPAWPQLEVA